MYCVRELERFPDLLYQRDQPLRALSLVGARVDKATEARVHAGNIS